MYGESQRSMADALDLLEKGEDRRVKLLEESAAIEERKIRLEERRLFMEEQSRVGDRDIALRRI